ncbi:UNVERIFIED_CONTAM: WG repeat-containing protein, partial [Prevotella sp. 15_C9]
SGFINSAGEVVIEAKFKWAEDFEDGQAIVTLESGMGIINRNGLFLLEPKYKRIEKAKEASGLYIIENAEGHEGIFYNNRLIIPP